MLLIVVADLAVNHVSDFNTSHILNIEFMNKSTWREQTSAKRGCRSLLKCNHFFLVPFRTFPEFFLSKSIHNFFSYLSLKMNPEDPDGDPDHSQNLTIS